MSGATGWPCQGGPLDGKMLAYQGTSYRVVKQPPPMTVALSPDQKAPRRIDCMFAEYRLLSVGPDRFAWVFQEWPE